MDIKNIHSKINARKIIAVLAVLLIALIIFQAGIFVGYKKAIFSGRLGDGYERAFDNKNNPSPFGFFGKDLPGGHGAAGKIVRINLPAIVVATPDNVEKTVLIGTDTIIRQSRNTAKAEDLKVGDFIVALGTPDETGEVEAKLVRLMPPPPGNPSASTSTPTTSSSTKNQ